MDAPAWMYSSSERVLPFARMFLDKDLVAGFAQRGHGAGNKADARFVIFDFLRDADDHASAVTGASCC